MSSIRFLHHRYTGYSIIDWSWVAFPIRAYSVQRAPALCGVLVGCQWQALPSPVQCEETAIRTWDLPVTGSKTLPLAPGPPFLSQAIFSWTVTWLLVLVILGLQGFYIKTHINQVVGHQWEDRLAMQLQVCFYFLIDLLPIYILKCVP